MRINMVAHMPRTFVGTPVDTAFRSLCEQRFECAGTVFLTYSTGRLEGIIWINDLFAIDEHLIGEVTELEHEAVRREGDQKQAARLDMQLNMISVPVADDDERLIGAVPPEALFKFFEPNL